MSTSIRVSLHLNSKKIMKRAKVFKGEDMIQFGDEVSDDFGRIAGY
jgi:hypothetical protein